MRNNLLKNKTLNWVASILSVLSVPVLVVFLTNYVIKQGVFVTLDYLGSKIQPIMVSAIPILLLTVVLALLTRKVSVPFAVIGGISMLGGGAYYYKMLYRNEPLFPSDLNYAKAMTKMADDFGVVLTSDIKIAIGMAVVITILFSIFTVPLINGKYRNNVIVALIFTSFLGIYCNRVLLNSDFYNRRSYIPKSPRSAFVYYKCTFHTGFFYYVSAASVDEPAKYSEEKIDDMLSQYQDAGEKQPDIIFILEESYFQPDKLFGLEFTEDISENYDELKEKSVYGNIVSPKFGGGTGEMEFTVLNQINLTYFPIINAFMNMYGNDELASFINRLDNYSKMALHAYDNELYNRENAYRNMGIDSVKFYEEYVHNQNFGAYISDSCNMQEIIDTYEKAISENPDKNVFINSPSMQNHVIMDKSVLSEDKLVYLKDSDKYSEDFNLAMSTLASYENASDIAIKELYDYLQTVDREVIVIIYGDHQSYGIEGIEDGKTYYLSESEKYSNMSDAERRLALHTTPFIMWSNKQDMGGKEYKYASPNMLYSIACHEFGLKHSRLEEYMYDMLCEYPVIDNWNEIYMDSDYNLITAEQCKDSIEEGFILFYDMLIGEKYSVRN